MWFTPLLTILLVSLAHTGAAPTPHEALHEKTAENKEDLTVEQLEHLKSDAHKQDKELPTGGAAEHVEYHSLDSVQNNGELVSRLEQHATADSAPGEKPIIHTHVQYDVPSEGVHREIVQDGDKVSVHDATTPAPVSGEDPTTKVFHGAARLVQTGASSPNPQGTHTATRRSFNDITGKQEVLHNALDSISSSLLQYSSMDMAEYVFWTGDEQGVTKAIEGFINEGLMSREEALYFLQEIKANLDYLKAINNQNKMPQKETYLDQHRKLFLERPESLSGQYQLPVRAPTHSFFYGKHPEVNQAGWKWESGNTMTPAMPMLTMPEYRPEPVKRSYPDPMLQSNIISTSDYDRDGPMITEEEYEEMMDKMKAADNLYTEYTLEEIIYQLAKMMFSQSLNRDPREARAAIQRFMAFLGLEAEKGQLSRNIEKKVLDVMIAALTDTVGDHPELMQSRELPSMSAGNRLMRQFLDTSANEPGMSRALLAAYKDELLKGIPMHKYAYPERN